MSENYLVIGRAKTGTTVIAKTIQKSVLAAKYSSEPRDPQFFLQDKGSLSGPKVVKVIFEHWDDQAAFRDRIVRNQTDIQFRRVVGIVRDPRDELLSRLYYFVYPLIVRGALKEKDFLGWLDLLETRERAPQTVSLMQMVGVMSDIVGYDVFASFKRGVQMYRDFLRTNAGTIHVLKYEQFMQGETAQLEGYLGIDLTSSRGVGRYRRTIRTAAYDNWKDYLLPGDIKFLQNQLGELMEEYGYRDWTVRKEPKIDPATGSQYVRKLIREAGLKHSVRHLLRRSVTS